MTLALVFVSRCKLYLFYLRFKNTEILLPSLDLAAAWENVGEVKSAVSEIIQTDVSGFHLNDTGGRLGGCWCTKRAIYSFLLYKAFSLSNFCLESCPVL